jgi:hypothetical protein
MQQQVEQILAAPVPGKQDAHDDELVFHVTVANPRASEASSARQLIDVRLTDTKPRRAAATRRGNLPRESVTLLKQWCVSSTRVST